MEYTHKTLKDNNNITVHRVKYKKQGKTKCNFFLKGERTNPNHNIMTK
jgi:hypothetical protein